MTMPIEPELDTAIPAVSTDMDQFKALFDRVGQRYEVLDGADKDGDFPQTRTCLRFVAGVINPYRVPPPDNHALGYDGFYTQLHFNVAGEYLGMGIWE